MKKRTLLLTSLLPLTVLFSCGEIDTLTNTDDNNTPVTTPDSGYSNNISYRDEEYERNEYYEDYENDEYDDEYNEYALGIHYQGVSCAKCHSPNSTTAYDNEALEYSFNIGGTIFSDLKAQDLDITKAAAYYWVKLSLENGTVFKTYVGNGTGNFWTNAIIPDGVKFKVEVIDPSGNVANATNGYTHDNTRLDCNSCHTAEGTGGAPGRIVNYDIYDILGNNNTNTTNGIPIISSFTATPNSGQPPLEVSFKCFAYDEDGGITEYRFDFNSDNVIDTRNTTGIALYTYDTTGTFTATCIAVDNQGNTTSKTVTITVENIDNANNTQTDNQLVSFSADIHPILRSNCQSCHGTTSNNGNLKIDDDATTTYNNIISTAPATSGYTSFIDKTNPPNSLLLEKAIGNLSHGGGQVLTINSTEYKAILTWIEQGAINN